MVIYLVVDDPPADFGKYRLISAHLFRPNANKKVKKLKAKDEYTYQYVFVKPFSVGP